MTMDETSAPDAGPQFASGARGPLPAWGVPDAVNSTVIDFLGGLWRRDTLSVRDRQLVTIAVNVALGVNEALPIHVHNALKGGLTEEEVYELILHVGAYAGFSRATDAFKVTKDVLAAGRAG
ncbi:carboxymuconolactone decarboxylase family protein [Rhodococcus sp. NPDC003318]|uniref:carboxymuconolactone decarboxylase family protein n=1 Tax=Rhodococcus sp. NPDC003318 TaxID=3364503 RepID=UPI0036CA905F